MSSRAEHYIERMKAQATKNVTKWGEQDRDKLVLVCIEELGELAQAHLQHLEEGGPRIRIIEEAIDLGAVGFQFGAEPDVGRTMTLVYSDLEGFKERKIERLLSCVHGLAEWADVPDAIASATGMIIVLCACICVEVEA